MLRAELALFKTCKVLYVSTTTPCNCPHIWSYSGVISYWYIDTPQNNNWRAVEILAFLSCFPRIERFRSESFCNRIQTECEQRTRKVWSFSGLSSMTQFNKIRKLRNPTAARDDFTKNILNLAKRGKSWKHQWPRSFCYGLASEMRLTYVQPSLESIPRFSILRIMIKNWMTLEP